MFDWPRFLQSNRIEFRDRGPNVAKNNIVIACPICGGADAGFHMGISLTGKGWGCWRDRAHRGGSNARLVQILLHCSRERAIAITGDEDPMPTEYVAMTAHMNALDNQVTQPASKRKLTMPAEFLTLENRVSARPFLEYLRGRHFTDAQIGHMTERYDMRYASRGAYKGRIVFPVRFEGRLVTWTARSVWPGVDLRYRTLTQDPEKAKLEGGAPAIGPIGDYLLWYDELLKVDADTICIVEGPFDALKLNVMGRKHGICATCFFTAQPSQQQIQLMHTLLPRFNRRFVIPDRSAEGKGMKTLGRANGLQIDIVTMPEGYKDPGEFDEDTMLAVL